jgi:hypothetical protein
MPRYFSNVHSAEAAGLVGHGLDLCSSFTLDTEEERSSLPSEQKLLLDLTQSRTWHT